MGGEGGGALTVHDEGPSGLGFSICPDTCAVSHRQLSNDDLQPNAKAGSTSWHVRHNSSPMLNDDVHCDEHESQAGRRCCHPPR